MVDSRMMVCFQIGILIIHSGDSNLVSLDCIKHIVYPSQNQDKFFSPSHPFQHFTNLSTVSKPKKIKISSWYHHWYHHWYPMNFPHPMSSPSFAGACPPKLAPFSCAVQCRASASELSVRKALIRLPPAVLGRNSRGFRGGKVA